MGKLTEARKQYEDAIRADERRRLAKMFERNFVAQAERAELDGDTYLFFINLMKEPGRQALKETNHG